MREIVELSKREQERSVVLNQVLGGQLSGEEAATMLEVSVRHLRRILAAYRQEGAAALAHGNRGRTPVHAVSPAVRAQVVELARTTYAGCNHQHMSELLAEREGIGLSRQTLRRILGTAGLSSPRTRRAPKHRRRRERYAQEGMLLQVDGSRHDWLGGRGPALTLIGGIDDATGTVPNALFREQEDAHGYMLLLEKIVRTHGRPRALYHDRHGIFVRPAAETETVTEQLRGHREPTQLGRVLAELGIVSIQARSPQAKGRIERLWGTFQDRLVAELRLAGACTLAEANAVLATFLPRFNARFAVPAAEAGSAYRPLEPSVPLETIFCFKYQRPVGIDNVVRLGEHRLQLLGSPTRASYARAWVEVQERLDGSLAVYHQDTLVASQPAPAEAPVLRAREKRAPGHGDALRAGPPPASSANPRPSPNERARPAADHPWRRRLLPSRPTSAPPSDLAEHERVTAAPQRAAQRSERSAEP
jgi:transposase